MKYEFICPHGHVTERRFSTIGKAIRHFDAADNLDTYDEVRCDTEGCVEDAARNYSNAGTQFYGMDWDKPAPSGRQFTKGSDPHKALSSVGRPTNNSVIGR